MYIYHISVSISISISIYIYTHTHTHTNTHTHTHRHGLSSLRWRQRADATDAEGSAAEAEAVEEEEFHGTFQHGAITGAGKLVRTDGAVYIGPVRDACPIGEGVLIDAHETRFRVLHDGTQRFSAHGAAPRRQEEDPFPPVRPGQCSAIALAVNKPRQAPDGRCSLPLLAPAFRSGCGCSRCCWHRPRRRALGLCAGARTATKRRED